MFPGMKISAVLLSLVFTVGTLQAQPAPKPGPPAPKPAGTKEVSGQAAPAVKPAEIKSAPDEAVPAKAAPAKPEVKKAEVLPKIPGMVITRPNGTFLSLEVVGGNFKLSFYDKKHKLMAMDVSRASARWPNTRAPGDNRTMLNGSGSSLVGAKPVVPPFTFNVYLSLLKGEGENAKVVENYTVAFRG